MDTALDKVRGLVGKDIVGVDDKKVHVPIDILSRLA